MKNLELFDYKDTVLPPLEEDNAATLKPLVLENGELFSYNNNHLYHYKNNELKSWYDTTFKIDQIFADELLNVFYIISNRHIRSISYEGQTSCYDTDLFDLYDWNGEADDAITNAALSPDKEHIILLTKSLFVITMLSNFKLLSQHNLLSTSVKGERESVNVGWGKAETQFQGSAKGSTQPGGANYVDEGPPSVVWCADSQLFAVNYYNAELGARQIKVFRVYGGECSLQYTSKALLGLESHLSWRPHVMSHLATTQRLPNKYVLVFIEKNTEMKDSMVLDSVSCVKCLKWNTDGTILAVMREDSRVLLYTCSNWHWYLKQDLAFSHPVHLQWTSPSLCSILDDSTLHTHTWTSRVTEAHGVVSVIDANEVLVTDLNRSVIPPPMCERRVKTPEPSESINRVLALPESPNDLLVITTSALYSYRNGEWNKIIPTEGEKIFQEGEKTSHEKFDKACVWDGRLVFVRGGRELCMMDLTEGNYVSVLHTASEPIVSILPKSQHSLILQLASRDLVAYSRKCTISNEAGTKIPDAEDTLQVLFSLPELCTHLGFASGHLLSLSPANKLYDNGSFAMGDVSSFALYNDWLIVTTLTHRLVLFRLLPDTPVEERAAISRRLERGGTLVGVTQACAVVLQMPRGNLETVTPRPLLLDAISRLLSAAKYGEAFVQMRKHRIDLDLLIDYAEPNYKLLVSQVDNPTWLSNLIADLKPEDVTKLDAFYAEYYSKCARDRRPVTRTNKDVGVICAHLRTALHARDPGKYALTIMHCAVKGEVWDEAFAIARQSPEALDYLILLHDVNGLYDRALGAYELDLALQIAGKSQKDPKEYVPYLNHLRSLPPYRMKAEIDKQFGHYLSAVRHLSGHTSRADDDLATSSDVLSSDVSTDTEECLELIRKHKLWSQTLDVFPRSSESYRTLVKEYALQLELRGRGPEETGLMYERAGAYDEALRCYVRGGLWRSALLTARELKYGPDQLASLYAELSRSLTTRRDVTGLVSLLEYKHNYYVSNRKYSSGDSDVNNSKNNPGDCDVIQSENSTGDCDVITRDNSTSDVINRDNEVFSSDVIALILHENSWLAIDLCKEYGMERFIESDIKPSLSELTREASDEIATLEAKFTSHLSRLVEVRAKPVPSSLVENGGDEELSDWGSDTASTRSTRSGHTGTSTSSRGRRKRKQERKLWSLKEGNPREEISLVKSLAETIQSLENCSGRVRQLCLALVRLEMDSAALDLQNKLRETLGLLEKKRVVIWPPPEEYEVSVDDKRVNLPPMSTVQHHWELECLKRA